MTRPVLDCCRCGSIGLEHSGNCATNRGRLLARSCRDCGRRFSLYSSRDRRVRCAVCRDRKAAATPLKPVKQKPLYLSERRAVLEFEACPEAAAMHRVMAYNLLRYVVSTRLGLCDRCRSSCDMTNATLVTVDIEFMTDYRAESYGMSWAESGVSERLLCNGPECGPLERSPDAPAHVVSWLWGAELVDSHTRMLSATLAR